MDAKFNGVNEMNLFEFFVKLNYKVRTKSWIETTATFTGKRNKAAAITKVGYRELDYYEYEIIYDVSGKKKSGWYKFYPLPDPEVNDIQGKSIRIKYNRRKPYIFENVGNEDDDDF